MSYIVDPAEFNPGWAIMLEIICVLCTTLVLYGLYIPLFIFSIQSLTHRNSPGRRVMLGTTSLMFILGTCGTLLVIAEATLAMQITRGVVQGSTDLPHLLRVFRGVQLAEVARVAVNNLVTDLLFLYRCYIIWGSRKVVLLMPAACILVTIVLTILSWITRGQVYLVQDPRAPFIMSLGTNVLLMCLAGGRIWYVGRRVQIVQSHRGLPHQYNTAIALLLESGAMYCLCLVLWVISLTTTLGLSTESESIFSGITGALVGQTVNIAPTVILVRVARGHWQWDQDDPRRSSSQRTAGSRIVFKSAATSYPVIEIK
ncbi:hypothetical protein MVEN_00333500 [Mycena venus]|uniref:Uncharacterized protein n=1 Tax=Mycena venus TaxID=2733690 RepID=A0A8H6YUN6_9AGAR|nr:hypothetical protein MVEN_00333500 [Mycena venus]